METIFRPIAPDELEDSPFYRIGVRWMLISAGTPDRWNTMTASWGGFGVLWERNVCFCFVRPTRHTFEFLEASPLFTLSFLPETQRKTLAYCGSHSGRDVDKATKTGLTPLAMSEASVTFAESEQVIECRKIYWQDLAPDRFLDPSIDTFYPKRDFHRMYVGEILRCLTRREKA